MADENLKSRHAFGSEADIDKALEAGKIDAHDILLLNEKKIGWIDKNGKPIIIDHQDVIIIEDDSLPENGKVGKIYIHGEECYLWNGVKFIPVSKSADLSALEAEITTKADAEEVEFSYEKIKYEFSDVPVGTLVDYREDEIRVMCPIDAVFTKQSVGEGGDANNYYATLKTYVPNDDVVGYIEHLGNQVDSEILTDLKVDKYGRKYQPTWLALASYDEVTDTWSYYGKNSNYEKFIGWDYRIDWFNADGVMIASDSIRINLSNEECHNDIKPYYVGEILKTVDEKIEEKIANVQSAYEIVEF